MESERNILLTGTFRVRIRYAHIHTYIRTYAYKFIKYFLLYYFNKHTYVGTYIYKGIVNTVNS